ncbi:MAG: FecR family protein [Mediterranea sp.]|jgi:ferric-dicitrate binding protein FerR (iron transport regulator)|nr:FecR family protein [Mediterranea sp.]
MEGKNDFLKNLLEESRLPLLGEKFVRKQEVAAVLEKLRSEERATGTAPPQHSGTYTLARRYWWAAAVAAVLVISAGGYFWSDKSLVTTDAPLAYVLPDGSRVELKENSSMAYNRIGWLMRRNLNLSGKAFFDVTPGNRFNVLTNAGEVTVHGTKFLVEQDGKNMFVDCKEGSVEVKTKSGKQMLLAGENVRCAEHKIGEVKKDVEYPPTLNYEGDPIVNVIADIEQIFHVEIIGLENADTLTYAGSIQTNDLASTLRQVFGTLGIPYEVNGSVIRLNTQK